MLSYLYGVCLTFPGLDVVLLRAGFVCVACVAMAAFDTLSSAFLAKKHEGLGSNTGALDGLQGAVSIGESVGMCFCSLCRWACWTRVVLIFP